jgi:hypothetical protein
VGEEGRNPALCPYTESHETILHKCVLFNLLFISILSPYIRPGFLNAPFVLRFATKNLCNYVHCQHKRVVVVFVVVFVVNPTQVRNVAPKPVLHYVVTQSIRQSETTSVVKFTLEQATKSQKGSRVIALFFL